MKKVTILLFCLFCSMISAKTNPWPPYCTFPFNFLLTQTPVFGDNYPSDADGILILLQTKLRVVGFQSYNLYSAKCSIYSQTGDTASKHSIGDITLNDSLVFYLTDSTYTAYGMDLSQDSSFTWKLGGTVNSFIAPTNQFTTTKPLISLSNFNLDGIDTNINRSAGFTFSHPAIHADSIIYIMASDSQRVQKKILSSTTGISFTDADLQSLPQSNAGSFFVIIYNTMPVVLNGKKYYFQNNSVAMVGLLHIL